MKPCIQRLSLAIAWLFILPVAVSAQTAGPTEGWFDPLQQFRPLQDLLNRRLAGATVHSWLDTIESVFGLRRQRSQQRYPGQAVGAMGYLDPFTPPNVVDAVFPAQNLLRQTRWDAQPSQTLEAYARSVLGEEGQQQLMDQLKQSQTLADSATGELGALGTASEDAYRPVDSATQQAQQALAAGQTAQTRNASQDILRDQAAILALQSQQLSGSAQQLSAMVDSQALLGSQLSSVAGLQYTANQHLAQLEAAQAMTVAGLVSLNRQSTTQTLLERQREASLARSQLTAWRNFSIPGVD
jgi:hypothetical protein